MQSACQSLTFIQLYGYNPGLICHRPLKERLDFSHTGRFNNQAGFQPRISLRFEQFQG